MEFIKVESTTGLDLTKVILDKLDEWGLDIRDCRGQGYDGAKYMSGDFKGVKARIQQEQPLALFTHCVAHSLNLCVQDGCSVQLVQDMISTIKSIINFFRDSPKRQEVFKSQLDHNSQHKRLHSLSETRWTEREYALNIFVESLRHIFDSLLEISESNNFDSNTKTRASSILSSISDFGFVVTLYLVA